MKKILFIFLIILFIIGYIFSADKNIVYYLNNTTNQLKARYIDYIEHFDNHIDKYISQAQKIKTLELEVKNNSYYKNSYINLQNEYNLLHNAYFDYNKTIKLKPIKVLSYIQLNDFSKVYIDSNKTFTNIKPLITINNYSAGIIVEQNNHTIAYLNPNPKCNYAVFIGNSKAPGITSGKDKNGNILVEFIPKWYKINIGDEVIASGMDNIFPYGIKVGKVLSIKTLSNTQSILLKPYAQVLSQRYFYTILDHK